MPAWLSTLLGQAAVAAAVAWLTAQFSLGGFQRGKWWEKKYEAYSELLQALHHMRKDFADELERSMEARSERSPEIAAKFAKESASARDSLMRYADLGDFLLSERAVRILKEFGDGLVQATGQRQMGGPTKSYMYHEYLAQSLTVINAALNDMKSEAKKDLKGRRPSHSRS